MRSFVLLTTALVGGSYVAAQEPPGPIAAVWNSYHDYDSMTLVLQELSAQFSALMKLESIGQSEQTREIWLVTIPNPDVVPGTESRVKVFFDGAMHGSEVISAESMLYYIKYLLNGYDVDPAAREIVDGWKTYVSCSPTGCPSGCTPNCFEYPGPAEFSEAESRLIRDQLNLRDVFLYLNGHAGLSVEQISRPDRFENPDDETRHLAIQRCVRSISSGIFRVVPGSQPASSKNWAFGVPLRALRDGGWPTLAFVLEIYTIDEIRPGSGNHWWWCRYNPPQAFGDEVAQWCTNGTTQWCPGGCAPIDTMDNRMETVRNVLVYLTQTSTGGVAQGPAP